MRRSESEMKKFQETVAFFKKYGDQYDLPWLLVAAQAYQESTIDQSKKSRVGAVGVMQIKPSTAANAPISITGVDASTEKNIQAGTKYLRYIADRYYKDAPMTRVNKGLFSIASYNAGPARIAQLRKKAQAQGLDPERLVRKRGGGGRARDRARDRAVREQHLQVLHQLSADPAAGRCLRNRRGRADGASRRGPTGSTRSCSSWRST